MTIHRFTMGIVFPYYADMRDFPLETELYRMFLPIVSYRGKNYMIFNGYYDKGEYLNLESVAVPGTYIPDAPAKMVRPPVG